MLGFQDAIYLGSLPIPQWLLLIFKAVITGPHLSHSHVFEYPLICPSLAWNPDHAQLLALVSTEILMAVWNLNVSRTKFLGMHTSPELLPLRLPLFSLGCFHVVAAVQLKALERPLTPLANAVRHRAQHGAWASLLPLWSKPTIIIYLGYYNNPRTASLLLPLVGFNTAIRVENIK